MHNRVGNREPHWPPTAPSHHQCIRFSYSAVHKTTKPIFFSHNPDTRLRISLGGSTPKMEYILVGVGGLRSPSCPWLGYKRWTNHLGGSTQIGAPNSPQCPIVERREAFDSAFSIASRCSIASDNAPTHPSLLTFGNLSHIWNNWPRCLSTLPTKNLGLFGQHPTAIHFFR